MRKTTPKLLFSIAAMLVAVGVVACDSNPTPHPQNPDATQSGGPDSDMGFNNNEGDPETPGPDDSRDNGDDAGPVASVDAAPSDAGLEEIAAPPVGDVEDGEAGECSGESGFNSDNSPNQGAGDPTDSNSEDGDDDDDDDDDPPPLTPPGRAPSPLEGLDWPRRR